MFGSNANTNSIERDSSRSNPRNGARAHSRFGHKATIKVAWRIDRQFGSVEDALAWGEFDAVANVTPDRIHHPTTMLAIAAGEHIFCEKPLATDARLAMDMTAAMEKSGKVGMVNFTYRNSPALQKGRQTVLAGEVGAVRHVEASHLQSWLVGNAWGDWKTDSKWLWRLSKKHGSNGALGDIGIHIVDFASYGSGLDVVHVFARLKTFDKAPPSNTIGEYDLDANDSFAMSVKAMIKVAWRIDRQFGSVEDALAWGEFDAVANVTPDRIHHPTTMLAIATGEHIFCEKPLATDATLAME